MFKSICIFSGHANPRLAEQIADYLQLPIGRCKISNFSDGEVFTEIQENVRGVDVYVVQPTCAPVNDNLMEMLVTVDALKRASAGSITAVIPYYGYGRQDRKVAPRTPSAREIEEADRASRAAEAAEQEAFARPKPQPATTR